MNTPPSRPGAAVLALLGPTNTGKTHHAISRMLAHRSGIIGLPLRLLAREVHDRVAARRGAGAVALITGEEKIVPADARFFVCTVEAMPRQLQAEFLAVDEIQLAADPERGHVFTDRLLRARGSRETLFLGSASAGARVRALVPEADFAGRARLSPLTHAGRARLDRLPPRSAVIAFSAGQVYEIAERIRRRRGGAAVVLGALSPRTRNAQVELFQSGEVDTIVATDAIGMGLNLDLDHVAFAALGKFDGERLRPLETEEIGQIAGRAGRHRSPGTFGVAGEAADIPAAAVRAVEAQKFAPLPALCWREPEPDTSALDALVADLNRAPAVAELVRPRAATDLRALQILAERPEIRARCTGPEAVQLLWDACGIPDYPRLSPGRHASLVGEIFGFLSAGGGTVADDWLAANLARLSATSGDIATLSGRLAHARTIQFVVNRAGWAADPEHWQGRARAAEDAISDALHACLVERFVDRTAVRLARQRQGGGLVPTLRDDGVVEAAGAELGQLKGLRFVAAARAARSGQEGSARARAAGPALAHRAHQLATAPDDALDFGAGQALCWNGEPVAALTPGPHPLEPDFRLLADTGLENAQREAVCSRLRSWLRGRIRSDFAPLVALRADERLPAPARAIAWQLAAAFGILPRAEIRAELRELPREVRPQLRRRGVRFGYHHLFLPAMLKPAPTALRLRLWALQQGLGAVALPPPGLVSFETDPDAPPGYYPVCGYRRCGSRAVRIDMLERLQDLVRAAEGGDGVAATVEMLSITGSTVAQFFALMQGLGWQPDPPPDAGGDADGGLPLPRFRRKPASARKPRTAQRKAPGRKPVNPASPFAVLAGLHGSQRE